MAKQKRSIRNKLMRVILLTSIIVLLLTFSSYFLYQLLSYRDITERQLTILSHVIASNSTAALAFDSPEDAHEILSALKADKYIISACLYDKKSKLFAFYPDSLSYRSFQSKPAPDGFYFTKKYIEGFVPVQQNGERLGTLFIKRNRSDMYETLSLYTLIAAVVITIGFLLAYFLSKQLQKRISSPIITLADATREVSLHHDYSIRVTRQTDDEIGVLTDAFNTMLIQIEKQNKEIQLAREAAQQHALELESKVNDRTIEYKQQKEFAEVVVNYSLVLIAVFDTETRIIAFNKKCEEEFKIKKEEVLGKKFDEALPGVKGTLTYTSLLRALKGEMVHNPQYQSGVSKLYYESFIMPLRNENGDIYAAVMTAHNITPIIETSEKLKQNNIELQRKNSELEQFAYVASHDLQEPLRKIQTFIQLAKKNKDNLTITDQYLDKIESSAGRMSSLIKDVLEYSRLSQVQDAFTRTDLNSIIENVKSDFELLINQTGAEIHSNHLPAMLGHKLQLHQLFANLISNAIKFCNQKPVITITASTLNKEDIREFADLDHRQNYFKLEFTDNGIGFEQQYAEKVFTIFQRLNTRDKYEGTGIGLALCKKIIENHKGNISVQSIPGKGTTFTITLPLVSDSHTIPIT